MSQTFAMSVGLNAGVIGAAFGMSVSDVFTHTTVSPRAPLVYAVRAYSVASGVWL